MSENRYMLAKAPIWRALAHLSIPMIAGLSVTAIYNNLNAGFVGSLGDTSLLAAITYALPILLLLGGIAGVFGAGGGTYISRLMGSQEHNEDASEVVETSDETATRIKQVSSFTLWSSIVTGIVVGIIGLLFLQPITAAIGATAAATAPTAVYVGWILAFTPAYIASFALEQLVRAEGAAKASMNGTLISTVANLFFDTVLILVLRWGIAGAGIAMGLANIVMAGYYAYWLTRHSKVTSLAPRWFKIDGEMLRKVFGIGASELVMSVFLIVSTLLLNWTSYVYGDAVIAGFGVAMRITQLPEMISMGIYMGALPLFAYAFGARNWARLNHAIGGATVTIGGFSVLFTVLVYIFREPILGLFTSDPAVLQDGYLIMTAMLISTIFNGLTGLAIAIFQATEQMRNATIMASMQGVLFIPVILLGKTWFGLNGIIWAQTITELGMFLMAVLLLSFTWKPFKAKALLTAGTTEMSEPEPN